MTPANVNFDRVARPYRWLEYLSFGPWLARCRKAQLSHLSGVSHAVVLGDGDGRFLASLLAANRALTADVVDSSQSMLHLLAQRVRRLGPQAGSRIQLHHADALTWSPNRAFDLIVSHFFLDCFFAHQLEELCDRLIPNSLPGARWVISEFAIPRNAVAAFLARAVIRVLYRAFGMLTGLPVRVLPDYAAVLLRRGFVLHVERQYLCGLLCSQVWFLPPPVAEVATHSAKEMI